MRTFVSFAVVVAAVAGLAGCYDLSAPDGPSREDFIRSRTSSAAGEHAAPPPSCPPAGCPADASSAIRALEPTPPPARFDDEIDATGATKPPGGGLTAD